MRTCNWRFLLVTGLLVAVALPAVSGERVYHSWHHEGEGSEGAYNLLVPVPFRTVTERRGAAAIRPTRTGMESQLINTGKLRVTSIHFDTAKAQLTPQSREILDDIGRILMDWPRLEVEIAGHADSRGSNASNQVLSERRANAVRKYLIRQFPKIRRQLLEPVGYGEDRPIAPNSTAQGMAANRRVEFTVLNQDELVRIQQMRLYRAGRM